MLEAAAILFWTDQKRSQAAGFCYHSQDFCGRHGFWSTQGPLASTDGFLVVMSAVRWTHRLTRQIWTKQAEETAVIYFEGPTSTSSSEEERGPQETPVNLSQSGTFPKSLQPKSSVRRHRSKIHQKAQTHTAWPGEMDQFHHRDVKTSKKNTPDSKLQLA